MARMIDGDKLRREVCSLCNKIYPDEPCEPSECIFIRAINEAPTLTPPNELLTLKQLREMDGKTVWVEDVKHWALIDIEKGGKWDGIPFAIWAENGVNFTWNVENRDLHCYRRPPEGEEET